jgi:hypothetical protein
VSFLDRVFARARRANRRIVLPEGDDPRVQEAARRIKMERRLAIPVSRRAFGIYVSASPTDSRPTRRRLRPSATH